MKWLMIIFTLSIISCQVGPTKESIQPNVIIIVTDDQGWGDLSINGNVDVFTPAIDQLSKDGALFERFYVQPVCSPTRAEILTGRYHFRSGVRSTSAGGERIDLDEQLISEAFKNSGYRTAAFGKWHSGSQHPYHPNSRGFDEYYGFTSGHWGHYFSPAIDHNGKMTKGDGFLPDDLTDHAIQFTQESDDPFFIFLAYNTPHSPMQVPDRWYDKFKDKDIFGVTEDSLEQLHARAALAMVENIDDNIRRLTTALSKAQKEKNTIVLFMTDNGPNGPRWNDGMKGRKGSTDEGGVRSPLFVKWPAQIQSGLSIKEIAGAIDLGPTLFDLCDIKRPDIAYDGQSLKALLLQEDKAWPERHIMHHWNQKTSIRTQNYKLDHQGNLYDMTKDPQQLQPITDQLDLKDELVKTQQKWSDQITTSIGYPDDRPFPIGHFSFNSDYLPVRDAKYTGSIKRSNRWPNDSYLTNWTQTADSIIWDVDVLEDGTYAFDLHYTCPAKEIGSTIQLTIGNSSLQKTIELAHDPPLVGQKEDRFPRGESLVKDFKVLRLGKMKLTQGRTPLVVQANIIKNKEVADINRITIHKIEN